MIFGGIDPGIDGAFCAIEGTTGEVRMLMDLPVIDVSGQKHIDVSDLDDKLPSGIFCAIERPLLMTKQTGQGQMMVRYGELFSLLLLKKNYILEALPAIWKKEMGLSNNKDESIQKALEINPNLKNVIKRKKDHNRAEAFLLAHFGRKMCQH